MKVVENVRRTYGVTLSGDLIVQILQRWTEYGLGSMVDAPRFEVGTYKLTDIKEYPTNSGEWQFVIESFEKREL